MRIVSLVPSITKTLFDLGLSTAEVAGRTKFCIHPKPQVADIPIVGGTKNIHIQRVTALKPDLVIANREENEKEQVEQLAKMHQVWLTDINTLADSQKFVLELGQFLSRETLAKNINKKIEDIIHRQRSLKPAKVAYLIWRKPWMAAGGQTFINDLLHILGYENIFADRPRYPVITLEDLVAADLILLSSEPYPFKDEHIREVASKLVESQKTVLVDGEAFSWFGTHLAFCEKEYARLKNIAGHIY